MGLVHGDDPERCCGEGGGRGVHVWEHMLELKILKFKKKLKKKDISPASSFTHLQKGATKGLEAGHSKCKHQSKEVTESKPTLGKTISMTDVSKEEDC